MKHRLPLNSITKLQEGFKERQFSVVDVAQQCLEQIDFYKSFNAVIHVNKNLIEEAKVLDNQSDEYKNTKPLYGIPILLKDNITTKDMPTTAGAYALLSLQSDEDAPIVTQLKEKGALIIGKANLSEWANYMSSPSSNGFSVVGGQTLCPYGPFDTGGSSSGSAVAVALSMVPLAIGSETCGSLISPASSNSVVTIKPTLGVISTKLVIPITRAQDTLGPIAQHVMEVYIAFGEMLDSTYKHMYDFEEGLQEDSLKNKRFGLLRDKYGRYIQYKSELEKAGCSITLLDIDQEKMGIDMNPVLDYGIVHDVMDYFNEAEIHTEMTTLHDIVDFNQRDPEHNMPYGQQLFIHALSHSISRKEYESKWRENARIAAGWFEEMKERYKLDAFATDGTGLSMLYSAAGYPAVSVPSGYSSQGQPYGITFVGCAYEDMTLLNYAFAYEHLYPHRKNPIVHQ